MPIAINSTAVPLHEHARQTGALAMKFVSSVYGEDGVLKHLNFKTDASLDKSATQYKNAGLPTINYRKVNEQTVATVGYTKKVTASASIASNVIPIDRKVLASWRKNGTGPDPIKQQFDMYGRALQIDSSTKFFNNDPTGSGASSYITSDADAPTGLWFRTQPSASTLPLPDFYDLSSQIVVDAGEGSTGPDLSGTPTAANAMKTLAMIEETLQRMPGGPNKPRKAFMDFKTMRQLKLGLGTSQLFSVDKDQFGRSVTRFYGCELIPLGTMADGSTRIISVTENAGGTALTGSTYTSIYFIDPDPDCFYVWQTNSMVPEKQAVAGTQEEYMVDWAWGFMPINDRAIARLYNIKIS